MRRLWSPMAAFSVSTFWPASWANKNSLPERRAESPVQRSLRPSTAKLTPAACSTCTKARAVLRARGSVAGGAAHPIQDLEIGVLLDRGHVQALGPLQPAFGAHVARGCPGAPCRGKRPGTGRGICCPSAPGCGGCRGCRAWARCPPGKCPRRRRRWCRPTLLRDGWRSRAARPARAGRRPARRRGYSRNSAC